MKNRSTKIGPEDTRCREERAVATTGDYLQGFFNERGTK